MLMMHGQDIGKVEENVADVLRDESMNSELVRDYTGGGGQACGYAARL